jgi:hypothetical protein
VLTADKLNRTSEASQHPVLAVSCSTERSKYLGQLLLRSRHDFRDRTAPLKPGLAVSTLCNRHYRAVASNLVVRSINLVTGQILPRG